MSDKVFDILIVGSGLSSLIFAEEYLKKKSKLHMISPSFNNKNINVSKLKVDYKTLPPQLKRILIKYKIILILINLILIKTIVIY